MNCEEDSVTAVGHTCRKAGGGVSELHRDMRKAINNGAYSKVPLGKPLSK